MQSLEWDREVWEHRQSDCGCVLDWHVTYEFLGGRIIGGLCFFLGQQFPFVCFLMFLKSVSMTSHGTHCPRLVRALVWTRITFATIGCVDGSSAFPGLPSCSVKWGDLSSSPSLNIICKHHLLLLWLPENPGTVAVTAGNLTDLAHRVPPTGSGGRKVFLSVYP